jgi:glycosyltransferase involved in cell wall biosynthesis
MRRCLAVCLSPLPWAGLWTSRHELSCELVRRQWDVVFVDPPANAARGLLGRGDGTGVTGPLPPPGLRVFRPAPRLPYGFVGSRPSISRTLIDLNARVYAKSVAGHLRRNCPGRRVDLLINSFMPVLGYRMGAALQPGASVYHRSDELAQFAGWRPLYSEIERRVIRESDVVICVSEKVRDGISHLRADARVIPNGVNNEPYRRGPAADPRLSSLPRPISVMVANFDSRVDRSLIAATASVSSLVMVGELHDTPVPPGAVALGHVRHDEIPGILVAADVGVVCYRDGWAGDVLKIYEYLAAGLPVVTSHDPTPQDVRSSVVVVHEPEMFAAAVRDAAASRSQASDLRRREVAEANSWGRRVDDLLAAIPGDERLW